MDMPSIRTPNLRALTPSLGQPNWRRWRRRLDELLIRASRRSLAGPMRFLGRTVLFVTIAGGSGFGSAYYMVETGSPLTVERIGPWARWISDGKPDADPYSRAHYARTGRLDVAAGQARYYLARTDSTGGKLFGDCEYDIVGKAIDAVWWSIAVYDSRGALVENDAARYAVSGDTIVRDASGAFSIRVAQDARPGNWLPVGTDGRIAIMLRSYLPAKANDLAAVQADGGLPRIVKVECR